MPALDALRHTLSDTALVVRYATKHPEALAKLRIVLRLSLETLDQQLRVTLRELDD